MATSNCSGPNSAANPQPETAIAAPIPSFEAEHLRRTLVARRASPATRWAAMADHHWSPSSCDWRAQSGGTVVRCPPLFSPMQRGGLHRAIQRQRLTQGLPSIRETFGTNLRALLAEPAHVVPAEIGGAA